MVFPSFNAFLLDKGNEIIANLSKSEGMRTIAVPDTPENTKSFSDALIDVSQHITLDVLRAYHEWLSQQLQQ